MHSFLLIFMWIVITVLNQEGRIKLSKVQQTKDIKTEYNRKQKLVDTMIFKDESKNVMITGNHHTPTPIISSIPKLKFFISCYTVQWLREVIRLQNFSVGVESNFGWSMDVESSLRSLQSVMPTSMDNALGNVLHEVFDGLCHFLGTVS